MNAPATLQHIRAIDAELVALCDRLDDAECARNFLRDLYSSLPLDVATWHCYAEDRIVMTPAYRALSDDARRAVQWAICPTGRLVCRAGMAISTEHIAAAEDYLRQCRDAVAEDDEVWQVAENSRSELEAVIDEREREEESLAEWCNTQREHERLGYRREA